MKTISLSLALIGCAPVSNELESISVEPAPPAEQTPVQSSSTLTLLETPTASSPVIAQNGRVDIPELRPSTEGTTVLECTSAAWDYFSSWEAPEGHELDAMFDVHRITIADHGDKHVAIVQTGHAHDRTDVSSLVTHTLTQFDQDDSMLYLGWEGVSISGWKDENQVAFTGGAWGHLERPTLDTEAHPAPPCGFEVILSCWDPNDTEPQFQYDTQSGQCTDENGIEGLNRSSVEYVRETKDAECTHLGWAALNEMVPFDTELKEWNLRGAVLEESWLSASPNADLSPAHVMLTNADLRGADLSKLSVPDGMIEGRFDEHTKMPELDCLVEGDRIDCES